MFEFVLWVCIIAYILLSWQLCHYMYRRIHRVRLKWWALPFSVGALLYAERLHPKCERPLRK